MALYEGRFDYFWGERLLGLLSYKEFVKHNFLESLVGMIILQEVALFIESSLNTGTFRY